MKKLIVIILIMLIPSMSHAIVIGKVYQHIRFINENMRVVVFDCVGGFLNNTDTNTEITRFITGWYLIKVISAPGAVSPDAATVKILDTTGQDLLLGLGANLIHPTLAQSIYPRKTTPNAIKSVSKDGVPILGTITLDVDDQDTNGALYRISLVLNRRSE